MFMKPVIMVPALGFVILLGAVTSRNAHAQALSPPEAVAQLLFSRSTIAMPKSVTPGRVTYRGARFSGDPERTVLSISASRAAPCLFEVFFFEASASVTDPKIALTAAYHATIDLRRPDRATFSPVQQPAGGAQLVLAAKEMFCSRNIILDQKPNIDYEERCLDPINDAIEPEHVPRMRAAFEVLRLACRW
jgi:hypothetical protein